MTDESSLSLRAVVILRTLRRTGAGSVPVAVSASERSTIDALRRRNLAHIAGSAVSTDGQWMWLLMLGPKPEGSTVAS